MSVTTTTGTPAPILSAGRQPVLAAPIHSVLANAKEAATIKCKLRRDRTAIVEVPRGLQLKVDYGDEPGTTTKTPDVTLTSLLGDHKGKIKSGSEWVLVRRDGVVLVDARVTILFEAEALMDMTFKGTIDLKTTFNAATGQEAYRLYSEGVLDPVLRDRGEFFHYIEGSVRFEGGVPNGTYDYANHFRKSLIKFQTLKPLELLTRQQFMAAGKVTIPKVMPYYDPQGIELTVFGWGI